MCVLLIQRQEDGDIRPGLVDEEQIHPIDGDNKQRQLQQQEHQFHPIEDRLHHKDVMDLHLQQSDKKHLQFDHQQQQQQAGEDREHQRDVINTQHQQRNDRRRLGFDLQQQQPSEQKRSRNYQPLQQQPQRHVEDDVHGRDVMKQPLHSGGHGPSSAGHSVRLSQHPDCMADVHQYCKHSNLHNFAVVECLQDDIVVSDVNNFILIMCYNYVAA